MEKLVNLNYTWDCSFARVVLIYSQDELWSRVNIAVRSSMAADIMGVPLIHINRRCQSS